MMNHEILGTIYTIFSEKLSRWAAGIWKVFECGVVGCPHQASPSWGQTSDIEAKLKKTRKEQPKKWLEILKPSTQWLMFEILKLLLAATNWDPNSRLTDRCTCEESFELVDVLEKKLERMGLRATWAKCDGFVAHVIGHLMDTMGSWGTVIEVYQLAWWGRTHHGKATNLGNIYDYKVISYC